MALTVNLKPSGFQPVGSGELIYQWTEATIAGKPNYRVEIEFNGLFSGLKFEARPDSALIVRLDVAPILLKSLLFTSNATDRQKNTYVKYQAVWDGGADGVVSLSGDVIYHYVGANTSLNKRTKLDVRSSDGNASYSLATGVFLRYKMDDFINERTHTITFLCDGSLPVDAKFFFRIDAVNWAAAVVFDGSIKRMLQFDIALTAMGAATKSFVEVFVTNNGVSLYYAYMNGYCYPECANPVFLRWVNDYGGIQERMFDKNQRLSVIPKPSVRYKTLALFVDNVTPTEWLMLNELNKDNVEYNDNYKVGSFVEDITTSTSEPIVILESTWFKQTKQYGGQVQLQARYPLIKYN